MDSNDAAELIAELHEDRADNARAERPGLEPAGPHPPLLLRFDQPARLQRLHMLKHRGEADAERPRQHPSPAGVGERLEG